MKKIKLVLNYLLVILILPLIANASVNNVAFWEQNFCFEKTTKDKNVNEYHASLKRNILPFVANGKIISMPNFYLSRDGQIIEWSEAMPCIPLPDGVCNPVHMFM